MHTTIKKTTGTASLCHFVLILAPKCLPWASCFFPSLGQSNLVCPYSPLCHTLMNTCCNIQVYDLQNSILQRIQRQKWQRNKATFQSIYQSPWISHFKETIINREHKNRIWNPGHFKWMERLTAKAVLLVDNKIKSVLRPVDPEWSLFIGKK